MGHIKKKQSAAQNSIEKLQSSHCSLNQPKYSYFFLQGATLLWYTFQLSCWNESLYLFKHLHNAPNPDPAPKNGDSWHLHESSSATSAWPRTAAHSWGHLRTQQRAAQVKGEPPAQRPERKPRKMRSSPLLPALQELCCRACSCSAGRNGLLQEGACAWQRFAQAGEAPVWISWGDSEEPRKAAPCQAAPAGCAPKQPRQVKFPSQHSPVTQGSLQQLCSRSCLPAHGLWTETKGKPSGEKVLLGGSESSPGLSESISCLRWCLASVGRGWGSFHFCLLTASSKGKLSCLCVCCNFSAHVWTVTLV